LDIATSSVLNSSQHNFAVVIPAKANPVFFRQSILPELDARLRGYDERERIPDAAGQDLDFA
jgi:hypothetical protein